MVQDCEEFSDKRERSVRVSAEIGAGVSAGHHEVGQDYDGSAGGGQKCEGSAGISAGV